jgi:hypothetical protein
MAEFPTFSANDLPKLDVQSSDLLAEDEARIIEALARARADQATLNTRISLSNPNTSTDADYIMHEVPGIGRYVIPRQQGWIPLLDIIHDPVPNIDFSGNIYPAFDGIIGQQFQSPYLINPEDPHFDSYESLRDNLAAVRNFLLHTYFSEPPPGMTGEKARQSLAEIAHFVGDGLYNNFRFLNLIPNHDPRDPHIDIERAREPDGRGAQYIYEKILEKQRHSNWLRPFSPILGLFGSHPPTDWKLPNGTSTHFLEDAGAFIDEEEIAPELQNALIATNQTIAELQAQLGAIQDQRAISTVAHDLDAIGNHLVYTASHMDSSIAQLSSSVRRDAVDIAKDILNKLKLAIGDVSILDGLKMKPSDDMATLGAIKGVVNVYERLLAWARANNDNSVFQDPSVIAATKAIGQLGALAKREAIRMADLAGNGALASAIREQMGKLPPSYTNPSSITVGDLLTRIERGMDTILNRTQQVSVSGASVGHKVDNQLGSTVSAAPTAGMANQAGIDHAVQRQSAQQSAQAAQHLAQAQQAHAQAIARAQQARQQQSTQPTAQSATAPARSNSTVGRQSPKAAQESRQTSTTNPNAIASTAPMTPAQQQALARQAASTNLAEARRREEASRVEQQLQMQQQAQRDAAARAQRAMQAATTQLNASLQSVRQATSLNGIAPGTQPITGGRRVDPASVRAAQTAVKNAAFQTTATGGQQPAAANKSTMNGKSVDPNVVPPPLPPNSNLSGPNNRGRSI